MSYNNQPPTTTSEYDHIMAAAEKRVYDIEGQRNLDPLARSMDINVYIAQNAYYDKMIADVRAEAQRKANAMDSEYNRILQAAEQKVAYIEVQRNVDPDAHMDTVGRSMMPDKALELVMATNAKYDKMVADVRAEAQRKANATLGK